MICTLEQYVEGNKQLTIKPTALKSDNSSLYLLDESQKAAIPATLSKFKSAFDLDVILPNNQNFTPTNSVFVHATKSRNCAYQLWLEVGGETRTFLPMEPIPISKIGLRFHNTAPVKGLVTEHRLPDPITKSRDYWASFYCGEYSPGQLGQRDPYYKNFFCY